MAGEPTRSKGAFWSPAKSLWNMSMLERLLVYVGVLVGVAGPFSILRVHDERDWAQRQDACHDFFAHRRSPLLDLLWQLNCRFRFARPPAFAVEKAQPSRPRTCAGWGC